MLILDYEILNRNICLIVTDYRFYMLWAVQNLNLPHEACFVHALNTAISRKFNIDAVKDINHKVQLIHNLFARIWKVVREIRKVQEKISLPNKKFPSYSITHRWSILELINVIIKQELELTSFV